MVTSYQEQTFYHYILSAPNLTAVTFPEFFTNKNVKTVYEVARNFALEYKEAPTVEQVIELIRIGGLNQEVSEDVIRSIYNSKALLNQYDENWLDTNVAAWIKVRNTEHAFRKALSYFKSTSVTPENATEVMENIKNMVTKDMSIDFDFKMGADFFDPAAHRQSRLERTSTGFPYIDKCLKGGWWKGSLIAFLAGPKAGKSLWIQNLTGLSVLNGHNTAYVTLELQEELVNMRIGSNLLNIPIDDYEDKAEDLDFMKKRITKFKEDAFRPMGALKVIEFPSSSASVNDIESHLRREEEILGIKFENVFIDYINIMRNWRNPNTENTYMKIKQISEDLRSMAMTNDWAVITVTQTNKDGFENEDLKISNVAESSALLHTVDAMFGIITSPELKARKMYWLKYLADRVSGMENTRKKFNVDTKFMRIEEDKESDIEDLDFIINAVVGGQKKHRGLVPNNQGGDPITAESGNFGAGSVDVTGKDLF